MNNLSSRPATIGTKVNHRTVRIRISDTCNLDCSYCSEHDTIPQKYIKEFDFIMLLENLKKLYQKELRPINLFLWGGEPLLNPFLEWFIITIRTRYKFIENIEMHSNLSIPLKNDNIFFNLLKKNYLDNITLHSSIHPEYFNINKNTLKNLNMLWNLKSNLIQEVNLMWHTFKEYQNIVLIKNTIKEHIHTKFPVSIIPTFQLLDSNYYKIRILANELFKDKNVETKDGSISYLEMTKIKIKGYKCNVPLDSFIINTDGELFLCQNDFLSNLGTGVNLFVEGAYNNIPLQATNCNYDRCYCEHTVYKER